MTEPYELFAIRYATRAGRRPDFFLGGDPHDEPMAIDYFVWVAVGPKQTVIIDTGFTPEMAVKRSRTYLRDPIDALKSLGVAVDTISDVILTHLHYDHAGNFHRFPRATFHIQDRELEFATGRCMLNDYLRNAYEVDEVVGLVRSVYAKRVRFHDGDAIITDGIRVHHVGGHSKGLQFVSVFTRRGWVVVASDASHFYENVESDRPISLVHDVEATVQGFRRLREVAPTPAHIIPGHDPLVMKRYPPVTPELADQVVRLDVAPLDSPRAA
jgi:glyoxylase-like metal-dependent hydrolase (beta-lactamase superfamily II)